MTLPTIQQNDLIYCTVNGQLGWLRAVDVDDQGNIVNGQFQQSGGSRQSVDVASPTIDNPSMLLRADYSAGNVFQALTKLLGVAGAGFVSR